MADRNAYALRDTSVVIVELESSEYYIIVSLSTRKDTQAIYIDPTTGALRYTARQGFDIFSSEAEALDFVTAGSHWMCKNIVHARAILGYAVLGSTSLLIVATKLGASIPELPGGGCVYTVVESQCFKIQLQNPQAQYKGELKNIQEFADIDIDGKHYFCETRDITRPFPSEASILDPDEEFVWNQWLSSPFKDIGLLQHCVILLQGFAECRPFEDSNQQELAVSLTARRSRIHPGTRYLARGLNAACSTGNEVECEQLVWVLRVPAGRPVPFSMYLWRRGTVPIWWGAELKLTAAEAEIYISARDPYRGAARYYQRLSRRYRSRKEIENAQNKIKSSKVPIVCVNLLRNSEGKAETVLLQHFQESINEVMSRGKLPDTAVHLINYDWHATVKLKGEARTVEGLWPLLRVPTIGIGFVLGEYIPSLEKIRDQEGLIIQNKGPGGRGAFSLYAFQKGVLRFNCADSLDRTNAASYFGAVQVLAEQCWRIGHSIDLDLAGSLWYFFFCYKINCSFFTERFVLRLIPVQTQMIIKRSHVSDLLYNLFNAHHRYYSNGITINKPISRFPAVYPSSHKNHNNDETEIVQQLCMTLMEGSSLDSLKNLSHRLTADHVIQVLLRGQLKAGCLLDFFSWVGQQKGFRHTVQSYCTMIHVLCQVRMFPQAQSLLQVIVSRKGRHSASSVFQVLVETQILRKHAPPAVYNMLMNTYIQAGMIPDAIQCFRLIKRHKFVISLQSCNAIISIYLKSNSSNSAREFFNEMVEYGVSPSVYTFNMIINCLCKEGKVGDASSLFEEIGKRGLSPTLVTFNTLISGHCKKGDMGDAYKVLTMMGKQGICPSVVTYSTLINGHCKEGRLEEACKLFEEMKGRGVVPDGVIFTTLMDAHCKGGTIEDALKLHDDMVKRGIELDVVAYNALVYGLCRAGKFKEAKRLLDEMVKTGLVPDKITYTILVDGFCKEGNLEKALEMRNKMVMRGIRMDNVVYTALITGLTRQGRVVDAHNMLHEMSKAGFMPDDATYTMVIDGHCRNDDLEMAFKLFKEMQHSGVVPGVIHYNVLINGLCKKGQTRKANMLLKTMIDRGLVPDDITYNTLIHGHCRKENSEVSRKLHDETGFVSDFAAYTSLLDEFERKPGCKRE